MEKSNGKQIQVAGVKRGKTPAKSTRVGWSFGSKCLLLSLDVTTKKTIVGFAFDVYS